MAASPARLASSCRPRLIDSLSQVDFTTLPAQDRYKLLFADWRGYLIGGFSLVWVANVYMSLYLLVRVDIRKERAEADETEEEVGHRRAA